MGGPAPHPRARQVAPIVDQYHRAANWPLWAAENGLNGRHIPPHNSLEVSSLGFVMTILRRWYAATSEGLLLRFTADLVASGGT